MDDSNLKEQNNNSQDNFSQSNYYAQGTYLQNDFYQDSHTQETDSQNNSLQDNHAQETDSQSNFYQTNYIQENYPQNDFLQSNYTRETYPQNNFYQDNTATIPAYPVGNNHSNNNSADGLAIASLIVGIFSIIISCCGACFGIIPGIGGIICAVVSKSKNGKSGVATAGFVCSIIGLVIAILWTIYILFIYGYAIIEVLQYGAIEERGYY